MAVPSQLVVYCDSSLLRFRCLFQLLAGDKVRSLYDIEFVGCLDVLTFVWVNSICQSFSHFFEDDQGQSASFCILVVLELYCRQLSVNSSIDEETLEGRLLMYAKNRRGLSTVS